MRWERYWSIDQYQPRTCPVRPAAKGVRTTEWPASDRPFLVASAGTPPPVFGWPGKTYNVDMRRTCGHAVHMSKMIQIRNVPDALHRKIKVRATQSGMTLSDYLLVEIERIAALPTRDEMLGRLHARTRVKLRTPAAEIIRRERESA
jgi:antitoxin FitA